MELFIPLLIVIMEKMLLNRYKNKLMFMSLILRLTNTLLYQKYLHKPEI